MMKRVYTLVTAVLTACQMWAAWSFSGGCMYFDNSQTQWADGTIMLIIGKSSYSSVYTMTEDATTANRWMCDLPSSGWSDAEYMAVISASKTWDGGNWGPDNLKNAKHYSRAYTAGLSATTGQGFLFTPQSKDNDCKLTLTYLGTGYEGIKFADVEKNNCYKLDTAGQRITFIFSTSSKRFNISRSDISRVYVYGSITAWNNADDDYRLAAYSSDGCFFRTFPFSAIERVGNSGQPEFLFHVFKKDGSDYTVRSHSSWEGGIDERLVFINGGENMVVSMPWDDMDEIYERCQYAKYVKPLAEWNLTDNMEQARISNFRRVPGTKHLYRSYHPFDPSREQYDTEERRLYYVAQFAEQFGVQCDIALSGDRTSRAGQTYTCGGKSYTITIPAYYQAIIANHNVLYVGTANGITPDFNTALYYSDSERFGQWMKEVVNFILDDAHPAPYQIHCALGSDRTGAFCATIATLCDASWDDISYDYSRTSELRVQEYRHPNAIRYCLRHMCGVDPTESGFHVALKQHFIDGGWLTAEQIAALKQKLNASDPTDIESVTEDATARKSLRNGQVLIERGGKTYTLTGTELRDLSEF